ncbi:MAG: histidine phosphatase family protein, partial [Alphaproteobacteria bacterium]
MTSRAPIFLVRHGETEWNRARRYQGWLDSPLTPEGIAQAEAIGRLLSRLPEAAEAEIVASPLGRARHTAAIIAACLTAAVEDVSRYPHPSLPRKRGRVREGVRASDVSDSASAPPGASDRDGRPRPSRLDERLREISLGSWDGLAKRDIRRRAPDLFTGEESRWEWY